MVKGKQQPRTQASKKQAPGSKQCGATSSPSAASVSSSRKSKVTATASVPLCCGCGIVIPKFMDHLDDCFLTQHITSPTRHSTTLDLVITSEPDFIRDIAVGPPLATSDHNTITWNCSVDVSHKITKCTKLNYGKASIKEIKARLRDTDWDTLLDGDIHHCWQIFKISFLNWSANMYH